MFDRDNPQHADYAARHATLMKRADELMPDRAKHVREALALLAKDEKEFATADLLGLLSERASDATLARLFVLLRI